MRHDYKDIRALTRKAPRWFDEHAVPRYCDFHPNEAANICAREAVLFLITCQACEHPFRVCLTHSSGSVEARRAGRTIADDIRERVLEYGDPPNVGCCPSGPTMTSEPVKVLEYWVRPPTAVEWCRDETLEFDDITPEWMR